MPVCEEGPDLVEEVRAGFKEQIAALRGEDWVMGHPVLNEAGGGGKGEQRPDRDRGEGRDGMSLLTLCPLHPARCLADRVCAVSIE